VKTEPLEPRLIYTRGSLTCFDNTKHNKYNVIKLKTNTPSAKCRVIEHTTSVLLPAEYVAAQLNLNPREHDAKQLTGVRRACLQDHAAKMAATEDGVVRGPRLLFSRQLIEAGELALNFSPDITLQGRENWNLTCN
jgi:hypothetical protein